MSIYADPSTWRLRTTGGIRYKLVEGPTGSFNAQGDAEFSETYIIQASDLLDFVNESFPLPLLSGDQINWRANRLMPGSKAIYTMDISYTGLVDGKPLDPFGADPTTPSDTYCNFLKLSIKYKPGSEKDDSNPETFLSVSARASAEYLTLGNRGNAKWDDGSALRDPNVPISQTIAETEWTVSWPRVPNDVIPILFNRCRPYMGCVNSTTMAIVNNAPAESLLFTGMSFSEEFNASGYTTLERKCGQVSVSFLEKRIAAVGGPYGHNHFYNPATNRYQRVIKVGGGYVYQLANLAAMFT